MDRIDKTVRLAGWYWLAQFALLAKVPRKVIEDALARGELFTGEERGKIWIKKEYADRCIQQRREAAADLKRRLREHAQRLRAQPSQN